MRESTTIAHGPALSVVSPVYKGEETVAELVRRIREAIEPITRDFEVVLVEDGSPDASWSVITRACAGDRRVKGIRLSRNFGQQAAITAGLAHASGRHVVVMDCDLQDDPSDIPRLYRKALEGVDIVFGRKRTRRSGFWKNLSARAYYGLFRWLSTSRYDPNVGAFTVISRSVVDAFLAFGDYRRAYVIVLDWLGFTRAYVEVEHHERLAGASAYSFGKLMRLAANITLTYTEKPLYLSIWLGLGLSSLSFTTAIGLIIRYYRTTIGQDALGWTSLIVSIYFLSGLILTSLGVLGLYVGRMFEQVKQRPVFVVGDVRNIDVAHRAPDVRLQAR